ncbi:hypothetical protein EON65_40790 [archaeon]|nr:MAG: hypothetical protein EON65_40790 [archaeon]
MSPTGTKPSGGKEDGGGLLYKLRDNRALRVVAMACVGAVAAPYILTAGFTLIGLSTVGPTVGGWFAANMGAGLVAGGAMATVQSAAMTTATYTTAAWVGLGGGAVVGASC